jgi:hypothetical protein
MFDKMYRYIESKGLTESSLTSCFPERFLREEPRGKTKRIQRLFFGRLSRLQTGTAALGTKKIPKNGVAALCSSYE